MKANVHFWSYLAQFSLEWEIFQTELVTENQNTHFVFNKFLSENRDVNEITWEKIAE